METITNLLDQLATLTGEAQVIANCLSSLREELTDDQWEALEESPLGNLVNACLDLEYTVESLSS